MKTVFNPLVASPMLASVEQLVEALEVNWQALRRRAMELGGEELMPKHRTDGQQLWLFPEAASLVSKKFSQEHTEQEFGCGAFGCVYQTFNPGVVFKLTLDASEAHLAYVLTQLRGGYPRGVVRYFGVFRLRGLYGRQDDWPMYALWREEASVTGRAVAPFLARLSDAEELLEDYEALFKPEVVALRNLGESIFDSARELREGSSPQIIRRTLAEWWEDGQQQGTQTHVGRNLDRYFEHAGYLGSSNLGADMSELYLRLFVEEIILGDVHLGNVGITTADAAKNKIQMTITDPGKVTFFSEQWAKRKPPMI